MVVFICTYCNFRYTPRSGKTVPPDTCGNCGTPGALMVEPDAEALLNEVTEKGFL